MRAIAPFTVGRCAVLYPTQPTIVRWWVFAHHLDRTGGAMQPSDLPTRLRDYRDTNGLSAHRLAELVGVSEITVVRWENGTSKPSPADAAKLEHLGLGSIALSDTKYTSTPRLALGANEEPHAGIRPHLVI